MNLTILYKFVSKNPDHFMISKPWSRDGFTFATDGYLLLRLPEMKEIATNEDAPDVIQIFDFSIPTNSFELPALSEKITRDCPECNGRGDHHFRTKMNDYDVDCLTCKGTGQQEKLQVIKIGEAYFDIKLLYKLRLNLINIKIFPRKSNEAAYFTFQGGDGLIMPIRWQEGQEEKWV